MKVKLIVAHTPLHKAIIRLDDLHKKSKPLLIGAHRKVRPMKKGTQNVNSVHYDQALSLWH